VHLGQYAFFTAVLYLVKAYVNMATKKLFKGSPLVRQKGICGDGLIMNRNWWGTGGWNCDWSKLSLIVLIFILYTDFKQLPLPHVL